MASPFSPAARRQTSVVLTKCSATGDYRLVISVCTRKTTEVIRVNTSTGGLEQENDRVCESTYDNEAEALDVLKQAGYDMVERGHALLGYAVVGATAGVLLATRVREKGVLPGGHTVQLVTDSQWVLIPLQNDAAGAIFAASQAGLPAPARQDQDFWRAVQQFTLNNAHYYCETADISRPFPSPEDASNPNPEFVWNSWLRQPLVDMGLFAHCPPLLQGAVESATEAHPSGQRFSMALVSRRSRRHPGTRYIARGLNERAGPGNEIESELLVWTHPPEQPPASLAYGPNSSTSSGSGAAAVEPLRWSRVVWRRGTVPIWWGVQLQSLQKGLQAEVYVRSDHPYRGTVSYFRSVQRQHVPRPCLAAPPGTAGGSTAGAAAATAATAGSEQGEGEDLSIEVPVTCINLLHCNPKKAAELMLSSHFQDSMRHVRRVLGSEVPIRLVNFDWHGNMGSLTEEKAVEGFWAFMEAFLKSTGLASGTMEPTAEALAAQQQWAAQQASTQGGSASSGRPSRRQLAPASPGTAAAAAAAAPTGDTTPWGSGWRMRWQSQQHGVLRINCADSLDRTNAASCFGMLPALQEALRLVGVQLDVGSTAPATVALQRGKQRLSHSSQGSTQDLTATAATATAVPTEPESQPPPVPLRWEMRLHNGRPLYIDHHRQRTQWDPPPNWPNCSQERLPAAPGSDGQPSPPPKPPSGSSGGRLMQSAADLLGRLQRNSSPPRGGTSGSSTPQGHSSSFSSLSQLMGPDSSSPDLPMPSAVPLTPMPSPQVPPSSSLLVGAAALSSSQQDLGQPWAFFQLSLQDVRERLLKEAVADYVEMFKVHGDIHSFLYTGSPAMHSHVLSLVVQSRQSYGASSGVGKLQNLRVAVQRRWNNTVSDASRQQAIELFLGMNLGKHFPGLPVLFEDRTDLGPLEGVDQKQAQELPVQADAAVPAAKADAGHAGGGAAAAAAGLTTGNGDGWDAWGPLGAGAAAAAAAGRPAGQEDEEEEEEGGHAIAVPGVLAHEHDGRLGVTTPLIDLEPLLGDEETDPSSGGGSGSNSAVVHNPLLAHSSSSDSAFLRGMGGSGGGASSGSEAGVTEPPPSLPHPLADFETRTGSSAATTALVGRQLQDLLL